MDHTRTTSSEDNRSKSKFFERWKPSKSSRSHVGKAAEAKTFYEWTEEDSDKAPKWVEHASITLPGRKKLQFEEAAVQLYKVPDSKPNFANTTQYTVDYVRLQSPFLRKELQPLLEKHGVAFEEEKADIHWPLSALFFERHRIQYLTDECKEDITREHLELLCKIINEELGSTIDEAEALRKERKITYDLLWTLYPTDSLIISAAKPCHQGYRIHRKPRYESSGSFCIDCQSALFDGLQYGTRSNHFCFYRFSGTKSIGDLDVFPYTINETPDTLYERMCSRGKKVLQYQDHHYMQIRAPHTTNSKSSYNEVVKSLWRGDAHGKAIIDMHAYVQSMSFYRPDMDVLTAYSDDEDGRLLSEWAKGVREADNSNTPSRRLERQEQEKNIEVVLRDPTNLFILRPMLRGFSLLSKTWESFTVDSLTPTSSDTLAFDDLVIETKKKELLYSLVESHNKFMAPMEDLVGGKGQGLRVLLSGPPGTGKTLMAEAIADKAGCPLYSVNAQDLGEGPAAISSNFARIMKNAAEWNALVLLDEADVYLRERSESRAEKNELVTVFLRHLEYYRGILFLTTNLVNVLDQAVESRIHVHIEFSPLLPPARSIVWKNFLSRLPSETHTLTQQEIQELGFWNLNGRQIENALFMTLTWCRQSGTPVSFNGIEDIISMTCPRSKKVDGEDALTNGDTGDFKGKEDHCSSLLDL